jgi:hypothetical protein
MEGGLAVDWADRAQGNARQTVAVIPAKNPTLRLVPVRLNTAKILKISAPILS